MVNKNMKENSISKDEILEAIEMTDYKYFGDYEMSDQQREAVDLLVRVAKEYISKQSNTGE